MKILHTNGGNSTYMYPHILPITVPSIECESLVIIVVIIRSAFILSLLGRFLYLSHSFLDMGNQYRYSNFSLSAILLAST